MGINMITAYQSYIRSFPAGICKRCCPSGGEGKISNDRANLTFTNNVMLITKLLTSGRFVSEVHG